ncbi:MAG: hypothetical protein ACRYGR_01185 [Janthinobacterium lividum]
MKIWPIIALTWGINVSLMASEQEREPASYKVIDSSKKDIEDLNAASDPQRKWHEKISNFLKSVGQDLPTYTPQVAFDTTIELLTLKNYLLDHKQTSQFLRLLNKSGDLLSRQSSHDILRKGIFLERSKDKDANQKTIDYLQYLLDTNPVKKLPDPAPVEKLPDTATIKKSLDSKRIEYNFNSIQSLRQAIKDISNPMLLLDENKILNVFESFFKTLGHRVLCDEILKHLEDEKTVWKTELFLYDFISKDKKFVQENYAKLSAAYCNMMFHYFQKYNDNKKDPLGLEKNYQEFIVPLLHILPKAYQFKSEKTQKYTDHIVKNLNNVELNSGTLQVLASLAPIDINVYNQAQEEVFKSRIDIIIDYFFDHPSEIEKFTNTALSFDNILTSIVNKLAQPEGKDQHEKPHRYQRAFSTFLIRGETHFERFEDLIADNIYDILIFNSTLNSFDVFNLFKSSSKIFHGKVFDALIRFIAAKSNQSNNLIVSSFIDEFFSKSMPYLPQQPTEFYDNIYYTLNKNNACYALQKLWIFMAQHTDHKNYSDLKLTLHLQILRYFNQPLLHNLTNYQNMAFNKFINEILVKTLQEQKMPLTKIHEFIEVGEKTRFSNYFNPEILYSLDGLMAQDDDFSLKDRSIAFTSQFMAHADENTLDIFWTQFNTLSLPQPFKQFVELHFKAFEKDLPCYKYFAILRQMIELKDKYPDLRPLSNMTKLYNVYDQDSNLEKFSLGLKVLKRNFLDSFADHEGNLYGFVHAVEGKCLSQDPAPFIVYSCDGKSGYANWKIEINLKSGIERPFKTIFEDTLYLLSENNNIFRINTKTGQILNGIEINYLDFPLTYIGSSSNGTLFLVYS